MMLWYDEKLELKNVLSLAWPPELIQPLPPKLKTALDSVIDRKPLVAAAVRHTVKLGTHKRVLEEAGDQGLPFTKGPLVFEATGAMGEEPQKWWKSIVEMEAD